MEPKQIKRNKKKYENGKLRDGGQFVAVPHQVLNSSAYLSLGAYAVKLLFDLAVQYRGDNNGDLCASFKFMQARGWKSKETLQKAKNELLKVGLIVETRKGWRPNKASLYAITWFDLDFCKGKLDIDTKGYQRSAYKLYQSA
jgi:hypothetical protein